MTQEGYVPEFMKTDALLKKQVGELKKGLFDPFIERTTGYVSPETKMNRLMADTDFSSKESIQNTFNTLMKQDPMKAAQWLKNSEAAIKLFDKNQLSLSDLRTKQLIGKDILEEKANQLVGKIGTPTDYSTAVKMLQILDSQGLTNTNVYKGLKEDIRNYSAKVGTTVTEGQTQTAKDVVDEFVKTGVKDKIFDYFGFNRGQTLPTNIQNYEYWNDIDNLANFVATYAKAYKTTPESVIQGVLNGTIDPNKMLAPPMSVNKVSVPQNNSTNNSGGFVPNFDLTKPFK